MFRIIGGGEGTNIRGLNNYLSYFGASLFNVL